MTIDVEEELRAALRTSAATVRLPPGMSDAVRAGARRQRRLRQVALTATAVVTAAATAVTIYMVLPEDSSAAVVPATPSVAPSDTSVGSPSPAAVDEASLGPGRIVGGIAVTYLPDGLEWDGQGPGDVPGTEPGTTGRGARTYSASYVPEPGGDEWGVYTPDLVGDPDYPYVPD